LVKKISSKSSQTVRVIGGKWRSRRLNFVPVDGLRPTGDRIRETLFNWLAPSIEGAKCLDLFAGSGALSFEILSRGAASCVALENSADAVAQLRANQTNLDADNLAIVYTDTRDYLRQTNSANPYNIVFMDPPFEHRLHGEISRSLNRGGWLAPNALIYSELPISEHADTPQNWQLLKEKTTGKVRYCLYETVA